MSELQGILDKVLSNPDDMKKIMEMAGSLMAGSGDTPEKDTSPPPPAEPQGTGGLGGLSGLLDGASSITPEMGAAAMKLMKGFGGQKNDKAALVGAMKPYLSEGRQSKLDRAVKLARVLNLGLSMFGKDGGLL